MAVSEYQCEAFVPRREDVWDDWESHQHLTRRARATDFWNRYAEDVHGQGHKVVRRQQLEPTEAEIVERDELANDPELSHFYL